MANSADTFRSNLKELFEAYVQVGGTQTSLARAAGVSQGQISTWLKSGFLPRIESLDKIASAFGVEVPDLFRPNAVSRIRDASKSSDELLDELHRDTFGKEEVTRKRKKTHSGNDNSA